MKYLWLMLLLIPGCSIEVEKSDAPIKLYTFDCGQLSYADIDRFSSAGDYAGIPMTLANGCFLIRHRDGDLLWDLGLHAGLAENGPSEFGGAINSLEKTLVDQLAEIDVVPEDIEYLAMSHAHYDHGGQISSFTTPLWLVNEKEWDTMHKDGVVHEYLSDFGKLERIVFTGDYDVFGDGSVMILETPGHTPGHTVLKVMLEETGPVLLSGDLYHQAKSRELKRVPVFNFNEEQTKQSFDRFEKIAADLNAKVIIQHEEKHISQLPKPPEFLQ